MARLFICPVCKGKFKHHEFVQHRRKKSILLGWDNDLNEIWDHACGIHGPMENVAAKAEVKAERPKFQRRKKKATAE